jgi:hypothetical protein
VQATWVRIAAAVAETESAIAASLVEAADLELLAVVVVALAVMGLAPAVPAARPVWARRAVVAVVGEVVVAVAVGDAREISGGQHYEVGT